MKIGIYGGSFNPIHIGHMKIAEEAIEELGLDKLFFVPAFKSPFKSKVKYVDGTHRSNMIDIVKNEKMEVSNFEINRKGVSYSIDTVRYFAQKFPNDELYLIIGSDNVYKLNKWKSINEIADKVKIVVFKRNGDFSKLNIKRYNCKLMNNELYNYSSSSFREGILSNVDDNVIKYISKNYLYIPDIMRGMLDAKRHKHSQAVGSLAAEYAKILNVDAKKAWACGCLHDITKSWPILKHRDYLRSLEVDDTKYQDHELHAITGALWVKHEYLLDDEEFINAIKIHTTLAIEATKLDKVIYAADKLCEGRRYEGIWINRELIRKDFDKGFSKVIQRTYDYLVEHDKKIDEDILNKWK